MQFADLRLSEPILRAVRAAGYQQPTPIQKHAIPPALDGRDVLGTAQTGTGKTAAFALPILQRLAAHAADTRPPAGHQKSAVRALVLCPTRELAQQIHDSFATYGKFLKVRQAVVFGGVGQAPQVRALRAGAEVLVATPGRLLDLMDQGLVRIDSTEILVLDEADRMLDMGFMPALKRILAKVPARRQTLLFSATMPAAIRTLAGNILRNPVPIEVARVSAPADAVEQWVYHVEKSDKPALLLRLLSDAGHTRALVFTRTKHGADRVVRQLERGGLRAAALHGNKSQGARTRALAEFRSAQTPVLVATDIAARGLDVDDISHVYNYDLTADPETYIHRIGRTARAGASGKAVSFCTADECDSLRDIERLVGTPLRSAGNPPRGAAVPTAPGSAPRKSSRVVDPQSPSGGPQLRRPRRGAWTRATIANRRTTVRAAR